MFFEKVVESNELTTFKVTLYVPFPGKVNTGLIADEVSVVELETPKSQE